MDGCTQCVLCAHHKPYCCNENIFKLAQHPVLAVSNKCYTRQLSMAAPKKKNNRQ